MYLFKALVYPITIKKVNNVRGKLLFNIGLVQCNQSFICDAMDKFDHATKEQKSTLGQYHPNVADMYLNIGKILLDSRKVNASMDSFLNALVCSEVSEILYYIGLSHEANGEYIH